MRRSAGPLPLNERLRLDAALEAAFAPLRLTDAGLSPARVRAAIRWAPTAPPPLHGAALLGRAGELVTAVAAAAFVFAASLAPVSSLTPDAATARGSAAADEVRVAPGLSLDRPETFARWLRVGRSVAANDLLDPLLGVSGVSGVFSSAAADSPADPLHRVRQGLAR